MKFVLDMQGAQGASRHRGIGRYTMDFARSLINFSGQHEIIVLLNGLFLDTAESIRKEFSAIIPLENIITWHPLNNASANNEVAWRRKVNAYLRDFAIASQRPDFVLISSLFEGFQDDTINTKSIFNNYKSVAIHYDLIPYLNPEEYLDKNHLYKDFYLSQLEILKSCDALLAISSFSRTEAIKEINYPASRIVSISGAVGSQLGALDNSIEDSKGLDLLFGIEKPFLLYTGASDSRKNLTGLLAAYKGLSDDLRANHQLVLAGGMPMEHMLALKKHLKKLGLKQNEVIFTGWVSDLDLMSLYKNCKLFVFPSLYEGLGLPVLEAMFFGAPVISSNKTSLKEIVQDVSALFDPYNIDEMGSVMEKALADNHYLDALKNNAVRQSKKFSWDITAKTAISFLEDKFDGHENKPLKAISNLTLSESNVQRVLTELAAILPKECSEQDLINISFSLDQSSKRLGKKKLFVDISELVIHDARTGIQRVVRSILNELQQMHLEDFEVEAVYASQDKLGYFVASGFTNNFSSNESSYSDAVDHLAINPRSGDVFIGLDLQPQTVVYQEPYLKFLRLIGVKILFVVYDLLPILLPKYFPETSDLNHAKWLNVVAQFDGAVCISNAVEQELRAWMEENTPHHIADFKYSFFHLGCDIESSLPSCGLPLNYKETIDILKKKPTFLMVGTIEPRKRHDQVLNAFESLWQSNKDINLVFVGKKGWSVDDLVKKIYTHPQLGKRFFWLEGITDEHLEKIYASASCLIIASEGEGFCLPLIECAQKSLPIIARDLSVFREVAGDNAYYFSGSISKFDILDWLRLYESNIHPKSKGIKCNSWSDSAKKLLDALS